MASTTTGGVPVTIVASKPLRARYHTFVMFADFGDGLHYSLGTGPNQLRIPPGTYQLRMYSQLGWMRLAKADLTVDIGNEPLTIYYATPYTVLSRVAVGLEPQRRPILAMLVWALAGAVALMLTSFVIALPMR